MDPDRLRTRPGRQSALTRALLVVLAVSIRPAAAGPRLVERDEWTLHLRPMTASPIAGEPTSLTLHVSRAVEATATARIGWPEPGDVTPIVVRARIQGGDGGQPPRIVLAARATLAAGSVLEAERVFEPSESATLLFEIGRQGKGRPLTFAVGVEIERRHEIAGPANPGAPVQLRLEIQRVLDGRVVPLESNTLNTFVGEPVSYGFRIGEASQPEAFEIRLRPVELVGDTAIVDVEVAGAVPGSDHSEIVGRRESWMTSRDAVSTFAIESGEPPTGWRFLVTPRF